ncbi:winged helix-turn-helix domain-containing protein [Bordetella sp. 2513F-2]
MTSKSLSKRPSKTPSKTRPADIYIRFLRLAEALNGLPTLPSLDPLEERLLAFIAVSTREGQPLSVGEVINVDDMGSPATLHARLKSMREKGWLTLADTEDARRKNVVLTRSALEHFDRLSECLVKAARTG